VEVKHKLIRGYAVTDAAQHDRQVFEQILSGNTSKDVCVGGFGLLIDG
jgi:hypothetical protein